MQTTTQNTATRIAVKQVTSNATANKTQAFAAVQHAAKQNALNAQYYSATMQNNAHAAMHNVLQYVAQNTSLQVIAHYVTMRKNFIALKLQFASNSNKVFVAMFLASIAQTKIFNNFAHVTAVQTKSNIVILRVTC